MSKDELVAQIEQAFANTTYPGDDHLTNCPRKNCDDCMEIARDFRGKSWSSLTDVKLLRHHESALALMTPEALHYYLPAFMLAALKDSKTADVILDNLEFGLTPPETEGTEAEEWFAQTGIRTMDYFLSRVSGYTPDQTKAIRAYLEFQFMIGSYDWWPEKKQQRQRTLDFWDTFEG